MHRPNPLKHFIERQGLLILDGGLSTGLEAHGHNLDDPLWSARLLIEQPEAIRQVHLDYLEAGADCITTSSYQASLEGFAARGLSDAQGRDLLRLSTRLATEARDRFWSQASNRRGRLRPLVAASIGPYGAFLADGSEYSGEYSIDDDELYAFHRDRWHILADSPADLLACETLPSFKEAQVLLRLLEESPGKWAWLSFSCGDSHHLWDGTPLGEAVDACSASPGIAAVGINCTAPQLIPRLIDQASCSTNIPIIVYPNSGETYDPAKKRWISRPSVQTWAKQGQVWADLGAKAIGGCCQIGPSGIEELRQVLLPSPA